MGQLGDVGIPTCRRRVALKGQEACRDGLAGGMISTERREKKPRRGAAEDRQEQQTEWASGKLSWARLQSLVARLSAGRMQFEKMLGKSEDRCASGDRVVTERRRKDKRWPHQRLERGNNSAHDPFIDRPVRKDGEAQKTGGMFPHDPISLAPWRPGAAPEHTSCPPSHRARLAVDDASACTADDYPLDVAGGQG